MSFFSKRAAPQPVAPTVAEPTPEEIAAVRETARMASLVIARGDQFCSARGCKEETGILCAYVDRRERHCPTAWCIEHRVVTHGDVYCKVHAALVEGTSGSYGEQIHPDVENRVPAIVNWVAREMDSDVQNMLERIAQDFREQLIIDPVRFVLFGVERTRTWERSWKMASHHGVSLRIAVAVEEANPDVILGKVNSRVVVSLPPPWNEELQFGRPPESSDDETRGVEHFHKELFLSVARSAEEWREAELRKMNGDVPSHTDSTLATDPTVT